MADEKINTEGGGVFKGDIGTRGGDFIGRDKINTTSHHAHTDANTHTNISGDAIVTLVAVLIVGIIAAIIVVNDRTPPTIPLMPDQRVSVSTYTDTSIPINAIYAEQSTVTSASLTSTPTPTPRPPSPTSPPEVTIEPLPQNEDAPVITHIEFYREKTAVSLKIHQYIHYYDRNGDVIAANFTLQHRSVNTARAYGGPVNHSADEQKAGATLIGRWVCGKNEFVVQTGVLIDSQGHQSNQVIYPIQCDQ